MSGHSTGVRKETIKFFVIFAEGKENAQTYAIILRFSTIDLNCFLAVPAYKY